MNWFFKMRRRREQELNEELAFDLATDTQERVEMGVPAAEAVAASRRDFGNTVLIREEVRAAWGWTAVMRLGQDLRYGCRAMRRSPAFAVMAILSLAAGIGANTAIYSVMDAVLLRSLPVFEPRQLAIVNWRAVNPASGFSEPPGIDVVDGSVLMGNRTEPRTSPDFPWPFYASLRDTQTDAFSAAIAYKDAGQLTLTVNGQAELAAVEFVSGNFFSGLGIRPFSGKLIDDSDNLPAAQPVAVLGYDYWRAHPYAAGQTLRIGRVTYTICGVTAPEFFGISAGSSPALYIPIGTRPLIVNDSLATPPQKTSMFADRRYYWADMMIRLRPGVTLQRAEAEVAARFRQYLVASGADPARIDFPSARFSDGSTGLDALRTRYSKPLLILMTMVAFILTIACANIANLLLARAAARRREIAVRLSLGASRGRILRQLLTESLLLSIPGGLLGIAVAAAGIRFLLRLMSSGSSDFNLSATLDWRVLAFTLSVSLLTGVLFGLAPALQSIRVDIAPALKGTRALLKRSRGFGHGRILVTLQIALSLLLVFGAVLFVRTLANLHAVNLGFDSRRILSFDLNASKAGYKGPALKAFYNRIEEGLRNVNGVESAAASAAPLGRTFYSTPFRLPSGGNGSGGWNSVAPAFFETLALPILRGRAFDGRDATGAAQVAIVNETLARKYFSGQDPIGQHLGILDGFKYDVTIVGVSADAHESIKEAPRPFVYLPVDQFPAPEWRGMHFLVRAAGDPPARLKRVLPARCAASRPTPRLPV